MPKTNSPKHLTSGPHLETPKDIATKIRETHVLYHHAKFHADRPEISDFRRIFPYYGFPGRYRPMLYIFTARCVCIARTMQWQDVRLSVPPPVTRRYYVETAKHIIKVFFHCGVSKPFLTRCLSSMVNLIAVTTLLLTSSLHRSRQKY